ncbi:hypothetical protein [Flaviaesturariibacter terrae]
MRTILLAAAGAFLVRLDTLPEPWGIYFFEPGKSPRRIDLTMAKEEYSAYFKAEK